jgi:hypothetical protein
MIVFGYATDSPSLWTNPFPEKDGYKFRLLRGDLFSPDSWQKPVHVRRAWLTIPRPYFSFRHGRFGFYIGWKVFGVDNEDLKKFPSVNPAEVYVGSIAMQGFTWRFTRGLK